MQFRRKHQTLNWN